MRSKVRLCLFAMVLFLAAAVPSRSVPHPHGRNLPVRDLVLPNPFQADGLEGTSRGLTDLMNGRVLVRAVFVDSNGGTDPNLYNWTEAEIDAALQKIRSEYDFRWSIWAPRYSTQVQFFVEKWVVPVSYEPVLHDVSDKRWVSEALTSLGHVSGNEFVRAEEFAAAGLTNNQFGQTFDRATVIFFPANGSALFPGGIGGFAYLGGPYGVVLKNSGWQIEETTTHETGHLFWALDEYCQPGYFCCNCSAAPDIRPWATNQNCENPSCTLGSVSCIMKYNSPSMCVHTARQVGWTANPLTPPQVTNVKCPGCTEGGKIVVKGTGLDATCKVLINRVEHPTVYRTDTVDLVVKNLFMTPGIFYEIRVKRLSDGLISDPWYLYP